MVTRSYLLEKPPGPSSAVRRFHWTVIPAVINGLGALEGQLQRASASVRQSPARSLAAACTLGLVLARATRRSTAPK